MRIFPLCIYNPKRNDRNSGSQEYKFGKILKKIHICQEYLGFRHLYKKKLILTSGTWLEGHKTHVNLKALCISIFQNYHNHLKPLWPPNSSKADFFMLTWKYLWVLVEVFSIVSCFIITLHNHHLKKFYLSKKYFTNSAKWING